MDKKAGLIYYICDRKACANCDPNCKHTNKIAHAKNFTPADINGKYPVKPLYDSMARKEDKIKDELLTYARAFRTD